MISLIYILLELAVIGFVVYLITKYIPMPEIFKTVLLVVVAILVIIWVLGLLGSHIPSGRLL